MNHQKNKRTQSKYNKANSVLELAFVALFLINLFCKRYAFWNSVLYLTTVSLLFTLLSAYVAYLHSKLPKSQREKPNWISASDFSTHPYFIVALFAIFSVIGLINLFS